MIKVKLETPSNQYWDTITKKLKITVSDGIKDVARLASERCARSTFPGGTTNKTKESLEKTIYKDINRAYLPVPIDKKLDSEDGQYLLRHRNARGRVPEGTKQLVINYDDYDRIRERLVKRAGMAKAGWLQAARELRAKNRIPVWLRKEQNLADVIVKPDYVIVINKVRYASELITDKQLKNAMENAFTGLIKRAQRMKLD